MGSVPSSRLTRILQEKAALLKKQRESAEAALKEVTERIRRLEAIDVAIPEAKEKEAQLHELARKADWTAVEAQAKALLALVKSSSAPAFDLKRRQIADRAERIVQFGLPLPSEFASTLRAVTGPPAAGDDGAVIDQLAQLDAWIRAAQGAFSTQLRARARQSAEWAGASPGVLAALDPELRAVMETVGEGKLAEGTDRVTELLLAKVPEVRERRDAMRTTGLEVMAAGRDLGVPTEALETALQADAESTALDWPRTVPAIEAANAQLADALRDRVAQVVQSLGRTLESVRDYDVDPTAALTVVEDVASRVPGAGATDLPKLLNEARAATEEPVVGIVASLLDAVRPKLVEVRRLGRNASEVFSAMNRAREALRLKIYSEALAASQEAIDRVGALTADLDAARAEAESLGELLGRLATTRFPTAAYEQGLARARSQLERVELDAAREVLAQTVRSLGSETVAYFSDRFAQLDRVFQLAAERGFLPPGAQDDLARARQLLENGELADAGELAAALEVRARTAAGPYVARRVEELEGGFREIPDESLVAPVRRLLADADVSLRVKEDLPASIESLRRAEREFSAVFAAHASTLVEMLEDERKVLEAMGGTGDEIQRQIDEVQQIFNMGDFVKASRTSQEIRSRAQQQQLVRSEESISHAKLALVELGKMGLDAGSLKGELESAGEAARARRYAEAYRLSNEVQESARRTKSRAEAVLQGMGEATDLWQELKAAGVAVDAFREQLKLAKASYGALDFDGALATVSALKGSLRAARDEAEATRLSAEVQLLREDIQRLSLDIGPLADAAAGLAERVARGPPAEAVAAAQRVHEELVQMVRPVLSENLRTLEQDLDVARSAGLESPDVVDLVAEARRRLALMVPIGAAEVIDRARTQLVENRGFLEHAERIVKRARDALSQAELVRVDVRPGRDRLAQVEAALAQREYARAIEQGTALEREVLQATSHQVTRTLAGFQAMIARARHEGSDTAVAENLLRQARVALEEGRPVEALQLAARSESELERVELQLRIAQGSLAAMERRVTEAKNEGVKVAPAEEELVRARQSLESHVYGEVLEHAMNVADSVALTREGFKRAREALDAADRQVKEALVLGADVQDVVPALDRARHAQQAGDYAAATQRAREAAEGARWAIERLYSGALTEARQQIDIATESGVREGLAPARTAVDEAESALQARDWHRAGESMTRARGAVRETLDAFVMERERLLADRYAQDGAISATESEAREQLLARVAGERAQGTFPAALRLLTEEEGRLAAVRRRALEDRLAALKDRLWIGEKLGLDTTPVMELFSEAGLAVQSGRLEAVGSLVDQGEARLRELVAGRLAERMDDVTTELNFARDGLHVMVDAVAESLQRASQLRASGDILGAARLLLESADELNRRKSLHRELTNLHYLLDAALSRASERHLDTTAARALLEESLQARATDYAVALAKAREALQLLQGQLKTPETPTGFWALRRPPTTG